MKNLFFVISVLSLSALNLPKGIAGQSLPDPESKLGQLGSTERISIKSKCQVNTNNVTSYRECIWNEINSLRTAMPDPESKLGQLGSTERISIKSKCQVNTNNVTSYRECIWNELGSLGIRSTPDLGITSPPRTTDSALNPPSSASEKPIDLLTLRVQQYLKRNGYKPGPLDGVFGPKTIEALAKFAEEIGCASVNDNLRNIYLVIANGRDPASDNSICRDTKPRIAQKPTDTSNSNSSSGALRWKVPSIAFPAKSNSSLGTPSKLYKIVKDSVWVVIAGKELADFDNNGDLSQGSAVAVSKLFLLTNCHVVEGKPLILLVQGDNAFEGQLISGDLDSDRCIIKAPQGELIPVPGARRFSDLNIGERGYTIGAPSGLERTLGEGIISGLRKRGTESLIQTTAPISPGSSGGALFDISGNLLGITTFLLKESQSLNFAIAVDDYWR